MPSFWEKVQVNGAEMDIYASVPSGTGPFPAVVVAQHASGVDKFIQDMADKLATAGYAAVQGKNAAVVTPAIKDETLDLPLMIVSLTKPDKKDYHLPETFDYRGKDLSMITLPTRALFEIWFQKLDFKFSPLDWSEYYTRSCSFRDLITPRQKQDSHWADVYASGVRVSYRLDILPETKE